MRYFILICFLSVVSCATREQNNDTWFAFYNKDTSLVGYKDKNGVVKIEPKFTTFPVVRNKFDNIIIVSGEIEGKLDYHYLTKSGKTIGYDSVYFFDSGFDCESEGFIRFQHRKTQKIGMLNRHGDVVIPAGYDWLTQVTNGMAIGLKDAEKEYWDKDQHDGCEHFSWKGGTTVLLDTLNNVLVNNFSFDRLNLLSLEKTKRPHPDTTRRSFLATDGSYYSFIDFEKEFQHWLTSELLLNLSKGKLIHASYDSVGWASGEVWGKDGKQTFINNNFEIIKAGLLEMQNADYDYLILSDGVSAYMDEGTEFEKYFNNCGEAKEWVYPVMSVIISRKNDDLLQDHYSFLRTDEGYRLLHITMRSKQLN